MLRHKTVSYLPYVLALSEGRRRGADEVYFVNADGHVTEGAITSLFFVRGRTACTPAVECGLLPGITRAAVIELCRRIGPAVREGRFGEGDLCGADEIFCTNSLRGVVRVRQLLDGGPREMPAGEVVPALQAAYAALVRSECAAGRPPPHCAIVK